MSVNKVILVGRLGRDPEIRAMNNGDSVCNFSLATSENWTDRDGNRQERTEWHNVTMYRKLAEIANRYLRKGSLVYIEGKIQSKKYMDRSNIERTYYEIIASEMKMLGSRSDSTSHNASYDNGGYESAPSYNDNRANQEVPPAPVVRPDNDQPAPPSPPSDLGDDDIPF